MFKFTIPIIVLLALYFGACTTEDPVHVETKEILSERLTPQYIDRCIISLYLSGKIEFRAISDDLFCSIEFRIDTVTIVEETERLVDFAVLMKGEREVMREWFRAWDAFAERVETIRPVRIPSPTQGLVWVYTDNSDGFVFLEPYSPEPEGVKSTPQWEALKILYDNMQELRKSGSIVIEETSVRLQFVEGEWEIIED